MFETKESARCGHCNKLRHQALLLRGTMHSIGLSPRRSRTSSDRVRRLRFHRTKCEKGLNPLFEFISTKKGTPPSTEKTSSTDLAILDSTPALRGRYQYVANYELHALPQLFESPLWEDSPINVEIKFTILLQIFSSKVF